MTLAPPDAGWTHRWEAEVRAAVDRAAFDEPDRMPQTVVSLAAASLPAHPWASLLFDPTGAVPWPDATSSPVMVGVFEADAGTRRGPLRTLQRCAGGSHRATVDIPDVADAPRWARFTAALRRTSPDVRTLAYLPVVDIGAVLVLAAPQAHALAPVVAAAGGITRAVGSMVRAATASPAR